MLRNRLRLLRPKKQQNLQNLLLLKKLLKRLKKNLKLLMHQQQLQEMELIHRLLIQIMKVEDMVEYPCKKMVNTDLMSMILLRDIQGIGMR